MTMDGILLILIKIYATNMNGIVTVSTYTRKKSKNVFV